MSKNPRERTHIFKKVLFRGKNMATFKLETVFSCTYKIRPYAGKEINSLNQLLFTMSLL